jgi:predicted XRE-type DNA-binding protein
MSKSIVSFWDAVEDTPADVENMKLRSALMLALEQHVERKGWSPSEAARALGVPQRRVSDLLRGRIHSFGLESLVGMAATAGLRVELHVREPA